MRLNRTDVLATLAVVIGALVYSLWVADVAVPGMGGARVVGAVVLGLGWLASAVAVVPNVDKLLHVSPLYLVVTGVLGVAALAAGVLVLTNSSEAMLALLVSTTLAMWVLATIRHTLATTQHEPHTAPSGQHTASERERAAIRWWPRLG
jgi:hypothetical protein